MTLFKKVFSVALILMFAVSLLSVGGCTKYASDQDLQELKAQKKAADDAEKELQRLKKNRQKLEKERDAEQARVDEAKRELERIKNQ